VIIVPLQLSCLMNLSGRVGHKMSKWTIQSFIEDCFYNILMSVRATVRRLLAGNRTAVGKMITNRRFFQNVSLMEINSYREKKSMDKSRSVDSVDRVGHVMTYSDGEAPPVKKRQGEEEGYDADVKNEDDEE
jgi:hypothetical protein